MIFLVLAIILGSLAFITLFLAFIDQKDSFVAGSTLLMLCAVLCISGYLYL